MSLQISCNLNSPSTPLRHPWRQSIGSCHATTALRADWQAQLKLAKADLGFEYVRFHGLLNDDMGTLICQSDELLYSFFNTDQIFDFLLSIGMRPIVELSFMPSTLSSGGTTVFHYRANVTPPRDYDQWGELMRRLVGHWVTRYGVEEVAQWYFEVWNEPNLEAFWTGGQAGYFKLYQTTVTAIKAIDQRLRVGGPATAQNAWIPEFLDFCQTNALPVDFISTHFYPTDAFGEIGADTITQLEHAPLDVMRSRALSAREQGGGRPLLYTEWNITSNPRDPLHDQPFAAALAVRIAMSVDDVVDAYSYWTFSDIFEENYFPSLPFHGGFGMLNLHGIAKPIYRGFEMMQSLGDRQFVAQLAHENVALWVGQATAEPDVTRVMCINQAMPRHAIATENLVLHLTGLPGRRVDSVTVSRIDETHCNPALHWHEMGAPEYLSPAQVAELNDCSMPVAMPLSFDEGDGGITVAFDMPPQSLALLCVRWSAP